MYDLNMLGYSISRFQTVLQPAVNEYSGESEKGFAVNCSAFIPGDKTHGVLRMQISIGAYLPDSKPLEEREPFVVAEGDFYFSFQSFEPLNNDEMEAAVKTTGLQIAIPVLRGLLVNVGNLLNLPPVFAFPPLNAKDITWEDDKSEEDG